MPKTLRWAGAVGSTTLLLAGSVWVFWHEDWRFSLPTPVPAGYPRIAPGTAVPAEALRVVGVRGPMDRPLFLHFYGKECPCSSFNVDHVRGLVRRFDSRARFVAVLVGETAGSGGVEAARGLLGMEAFADTRGDLAAAVGVYSTPQAAIVDSHGRLFFRGNYNTNRYCSTPLTEFARLALEALLRGDEPPTFSSVATVAYGCALPDATEPTANAVRSEPSR